MRELYNPGGGVSLKDVTEVDIAEYCRVPAYVELFQTLIRHLGEPDLGLSPTDSVVEVQ
jgi:hypothetical protein